MLGLDQMLSVLAEGITKHPAFAWAMRVFDGVAHKVDEIDGRLSRLEMQQAEILQLLKGETDVIRSPSPIPVAAAFARAADGCRPGHNDCGSAQPADRHS